LHDLGKFSHEFQQRLEGKRNPVDHSAAGAIEFLNLYKNTEKEPLALLLAYCILGHHTGLPDYGNVTDLPGEGTLQSRLKTQICDYSGYKSELDLSALQLPKGLDIHPLHLNSLPGKPFKSYPGFSISFLTRIVYSTLVDADFLDTEQFVQGVKPRGKHDSIDTLCGKLDTYLSQFDNPVIAINIKRSETLKNCIGMADRPPGFFKLTLPTGGGKTLASMAFALHHAKTHGLKRIIYVIPFTSIIEQNAGIFKEMFGDENVLEHHSNFDWEKQEKIESIRSDDRTWSVINKLRLAAENWDIPIVVTTNVQFFESLFANRSSRCRKLHNIAKSVIVFDEAQMIPGEFMHPVMGAVWELVSNYGASTVFCTATQPNLERFFPETVKFTELASEPEKLFDFYKRVRITHLDRRLTDGDLVSRLNALKQVLCIVNTRKHASGLFQMLEGEGNFHLSTLMCPAHRKLTLVEIRERLLSGQTCRVISTSVMEAGIDVDFPTGYRALTGLDSINQAAGRVNRNMRQPMADMFIFEPDSDLARNTPRFISRGVEVTRCILRDFEDEPISIPAVHAYFERLYSLKDPHEFDSRSILDRFRIDRKGLPVFEFAAAAADFRLIDDVTKPVIIPFDKKALNLIKELEITLEPLKVLRLLQPYSVSIYEREFENLGNGGAIRLVANTYPVLNDMKGFYDPQRGLLTPEGGTGNGLFF
jgi:CRISPR-associated endonuclease/helicase Cas3